MSFTPAQRRDLAVVATGRGLSVLGDEAAVVALALWAVATGHSPVVVAALVMAAAAPQLLAAPLAGLLADRLPARRLVLTTSLVEAALCAALVASVALSAPVAVVVAGVLVLNVAQTVAAPAWQALLPAVVPEDGLPRALATVQTVYGAAALVGPAVGGLLVAAGGTTAALAVDAVSFLALALAAALLRGDRRPEPSTGTARGEIWAGVRWIAGSPVLRGVVLLLTVFVLALGAVNVAEILLVTQVLGAGPAAYGAIGGLFAVGLMAGGWLARRDVPVSTTARLLVVAVLGMAVAILALGLAPTLVVAALASTAVGLGNGALNVLGQTLLVRLTPGAVLGRVFAALQGCIGASMLIATAAGGALLSVFPVRSVLVGCAALGLLALVVASRPLLSVRDSRPEEVSPDVPLAA